LEGEGVAAVQMALSFSSKTDWQIACLGSEDWMPDLLPSTKLPYLVLETWHRHWN
jgi:hypothetical protein